MSSDQFIGFKAFSATIIAVMGGCLTIGY